MIMVNNKGVPTMLSYCYISLILLTVLTAKITFALSPLICKVSSNQTLLQNVAVSDSQDLDKVKFEFPLNNPSNLDAHIFICLKENSQSSSQPCLWQELRKVEVTYKTSSLTVVVENDENIDCSNNCLVKWVLKPRNGNAVEYAGCDRVSSFEFTATFSGHSTISTSSATTTPDLTTMITTRATTIPSPDDCYPVGVYKTVPGMKQWCITHCGVGFCPPTHCKCGGNGNANTLTCKVTKVYEKVPGMKQWCLTTCRAGHCPSTHCICSRGPTLG
ncbi:uncharacterized protein LOC106872312 [Octopus bimaculoides]|uniref:Uncharacterized protein n=1 Tax=Octopus bimaculoides TaxID=37653 RepID=A0A0L8H7J2_OCTBM|nr:uncharacterized protein LOC106872312 [Octopus bimaculoides]|eukprot:XP_014774739.1 PREDICTED: uncharacterized protein LOC106872312 [Octopus bimaculoides]